MIELAQTIALIGLGIALTVHLISHLLDRRTTNRVELLLEQEIATRLASVDEYVSYASAIERWKRGEGRHPDD